MNPLSKLFTPGEQRVLLFLMGFALLGMTARFFAGETGDNRVQVDSLKVRLHQSDLRIDLRNPMMADLMSIPGIGEKKAQAIVAYATQTGFTCRKDLMKVRGIGEKLYERMLPYLIPLDNETAREDSLLGFSAVAEGERIDLNHASMEEIMTLPGVGKVLAARIIRYREEHGGFSSIDDLLDVEGIGEKTLQKIKPQIYLGD